MYICVWIGPLNVHTCGGAAVVDFGMFSSVIRISLNLELNHSSDCKVSALADIYLSVPTPAHSLLVGTAVIYDADRGLNSGLFIFLAHWASSPAPAPNERDLISAWLKVNLSVSRLSKFLDELWTRVIETIYDSECHNRLWILPSIMRNLLKSELQQCILVHLCRHACRGSEKRDLYTVFYKLKESLQVKCIVYKNVCSIVVWQDQSSLMSHQCGINILLIHGTLFNAITISDTFNLLFIKFMYWLTNKIVCSQVCGQQMLWWPSWHPCTHPHECKCAHTPDLTRFFFFMCAPEPLLK